MATTSNNLAKDGVNVPVEGSIYDRIKSLTDDPPIGAVRDIIKELTTIMEKHDADIHIFTVGQTSAHYRTPGT